MEVSHTTLRIVVVVSSSTVTVLHAVVQLFSITSRSGSSIVACTELVLTEAV